MRVIGAGIAGLTAAYELARRGAAVELIERREAPGRGCSFYAGGMLAPWCEGESAEPLVVRLGQEALTYWTQTVQVARREGSLVVAPPRDKPELARFARRTTAHEAIESDSIAALEPDLAGRFDRALFFSQEAHLDPRAAMAELTRRLSAMPNVTLSFGGETATSSPPTGRSIAAASPRAMRCPISAASKARCSCSKRTKSPSPAPCGSCIRAGRSTWYRAEAAVSCSARR